MAAAGTTILPRSAECTIRRGLADREALQRAVARWTVSGRSGRPQVNSGRGRPEWDLSYEIPNRPAERDLNYKS